MHNPPPLKDSKLFKPIKVGSILLQNRLAYAPSARYRNSSDNIATDLMKEYYEERATDNGGLLIVEATAVSPQAGPYPHGPMIYSDKQAQAWKLIVDGVHSKGSFIAIQLVHLGRTSEPKLLRAQGLPFLGPSALYFNGESEKDAKSSGNKLREMTIAQLEQAKNEFVHAAKLAIEVSGFDFIEIHAAHMYLPNQFLDISSNTRTDKYGGSIENRTRFTLELVDELVQAIGAEKVSIRLSPYTTFQGGSGAESKLMHPIAQYAYLYSELEKRGREGKRLAYVHSVESRVAAGGDVVNGCPEYSTEWVSQIWKGVLIKAGGYLHQSDYSNLIEDINADDRTIIASSRFFTSNPDLANRLRRGKELTYYDRDTFYTHDNYGYNTWGNFDKENIPRESEISKRIPKPLII